MRWLHIQLGMALALTWFLPEASAQCCKGTCPRPSVFQNQNRPAGVVIARGTRQESKSNGTANWDVVGAKPVRYDGLELKIISGTPQRRLATVNNQTFLVGETLRVIVRGGELRVRCLEIRESSVLVDVLGEGPRELKLQAWH
jgi:hypothetical protein